ncbi:Multisite-specific tRNA:(cytosine-C(5))-methyltransferase trm4b [Vanrija pseudolonga]|uniref:Multisite-specific tRNA:(Cytosine-C(5))-methyltransferase trm4b n=1 Tax=Vanrija pseudolonga TaxID=143232 RepID=A0AAF0YA09_9TREE|nr:Multisite-specific tRNA:(cytosine-C(5))-methyltransferase trm4b [Vanrija pseudolonga]
MGRKHNGRGGQAGKHNDRRNRQKPQRSGANDWNNITPENMQNTNFEEYYKAQNIVPEDEWDSFINILKDELPTTFRVTGSRAHSSVINSLIKDTYVPSMQDCEVDGVKYDPPQAIGWYPEGLAWELSAPKRIVRKQPAFKSFQRFLVGETEVGNLSRQEAVSMIPPLLMDVEPHHRCLDMCAAPGSKTAQIIEALNPHHTESTGMLIANDADYKRTHMLVHQTGRMPSKGLVVTNFDATMFPNISLGNGETLKFDRILGDVPCSGDGTMRKNREIWRKWSPMDGNSLHIVQLRILDRAMNMLKPGGRLVYSTCSFNPAENEAVVAAALNAHPGEFSIVDVSDKLPNLKRRPGITTWKVASHPDGKNIYHETYEAYRAAVEAGEERDKDKDKGIPKTVWPPANATELGLERSLRLLPHDQNTGGFFVCVLEKKITPDVVAPDAVRVNIDELPEAEEGVEAIDDKGALSLKRQLSPSVEAAEVAAKKAKVEAGTATKREKRDLAFREDPFSFVDPNHTEVESIVQWFQLKDSFPRDKLLVRNEYGNPLRTMYIVNDVVKAVISNNDYTRLRMISAGVKAFVRQDSQKRDEIGCKWRVSSAGILEVLQDVPAEKVHTIDLEAFRTLEEEMYPPIDKFTGAFKELLDNAEVGNLLIKVEAGEGAGGKLDLPMYLPVWKAKNSMSLLIDKREKSVLSERVFGSDICKPAPPRKENVGGTDTPDVLATERNTPLFTEGDEDAEGEEVDEEVGADDEEAALNA